MKKIFFYLLVISAIVSLYTTNDVLISKNVELQKEINYLKLEKIVNSSKIKIDISDKKFITVESFNPKYSFIVDKISEFKHIDYLISLSDAYGYDWLLFAVQIFYESSYRSDVTSNKNASGLLQITRWTYGTDSDPYNDIYNIFVGISYFDRLSTHYLSDIEDIEERNKFVLAAYHDGPTNIEKYRKIAESKGLDSAIYNNIRDMVSYNGRLYVDRIINTYEAIEITV
jgi:membrane-bound lytic murein transglycosylase MltF